MEEFNPSISLLVKEKLKLKPSDPPVESVTSENSIKCDALKEMDENADKILGAREDEDQETERGLLYDCIKCAMDSFKETKKDAPPPTPAETKA